MHYVRYVLLVMALGLGTGCKVRNPAYLPRDGGRDVALPADAGFDSTSAGDAALPWDAGRDVALPADAGFDNPSAGDAALPWDVGPDVALPADAGFDAPPAGDAALPWDAGYDGAFPVDGGVDASPAGDATLAWDAGYDGAFPVDGGVDASPAGDATACGDASLASDPHNCGWCGHDCAGGSCTAGVCASIPVANPQGSSLNPWNGFLALGPTHVYFGYAGQNAGGVAMVAKDGTGAACIACDVGMPRELATDSTSVYWIDQGLREVRKAPLDGSLVTTLWSGAVGSPVAVDGAHVYWHDTSAGVVMQADADGANPTQLAAGQSSVGSLAVHAGALFFTTASEVVQLDLTGRSLASLVAGQNNPRSVAADATHVYWATGPWGGAETVQRVARGGGAVEPLASAGAFALALDATHVYAADNYGGQIWRVPKGGGPIEVLATGQPYPFDIAVDASAVYWSSETNAAVAKVPK
jgi:hypothetical protein